MNKKSSARFQNHSLKVIPTKQDVEYLEKLQAIVKRANLRMDKIRLGLDIYCNKHTESDQGFFRTEEIKRSGLHHLKEKERWVKNNIDSRITRKHLPTDRGTLRTGERQEQPIPYDIDTQYDIAGELNSLTEDCNRYLLERAQVGLDIQEIKKERNKKKERRKEAITVFEVEVSDILKECGEFGVASTIQYEKQLEIIFDPQKWPECGRDHRFKNKFDNVKTSMDDIPRYFETKISGIALSVLEIE